MRLKYLPLFLAVACNGTFSEEEFEQASQTQQWTQQWTVSGQITDTKADVSESTVKGRQIAVYDYDTGILVYTAQSNTATSLVTGSGLLRKGHRYTWYILAGGIAYDRGGGCPVTFPARESDVAAIRYVCPGSLTSSVTTYGMDRAGKLGPMTPEDADQLDGENDEMIIIPMDRLWSKVSLHFNTSGMQYYSVTVNSVTQGKGSKVFCPFSPGGGAATAESEMDDLPGCGTLTAAQRSGSEPIVLYFPENMLGELLPGNDDPYQKSADAVHDTLPGREKLLSTVEIDCSANSEFGVNGSGTYRLCLGEDNIRDFSLRRNTTYDVTLTTTDSGLMMDIWKSSFSFTDVRSLSFTGIKRCATDDDGPYVITGESIALNPGGKCYAYASFSDGTNSGVDFTLSAYDAALGWKMNQDSARELTDAGITWNLASRRVYSGINMNVWSEEEYNLYHSTLGGGPVHNLSWEAFFVFTDGGTCTDNRIIPVTIETFDGRNQATVTIYSGQNGNLELSGMENARYIGQKGTLTATSLPTGYSKVRFSSSSGLVSVARIDDLSCSVSLLHEGAATIDMELWNGSAWLSSNPLTGRPFNVSIPITAPRLKVTPESADLAIDGTPVGVSVTYTNWAGTPMTPSTGAGDIYSFDPTLYNTYLKPVFVFSSGVGALLNPGSGVQEGLSSLAVNRLGGSGHTIEEYKGATWPGAVTVRAKNCSDITPKSIDVGIIDPVPGAAPQRFLKTITSHSMDRENFDFRVDAQAVSTGEVFHLDELQNLNPATSTITSGVTDLGFTLLGNGRVSTFVKDLGTPAEGKVYLKANITNSISGESRSYDIGYAEVYLVSCLGARAYSPIEDYMIFDPRVFSTVVRREAIAVMSNVVYANQSGLQSPGLRDIADLVFDVNFLKMSHLPDRMTNYIRRQATYNPSYLDGTGYMQVFLPIYINQDYAHHRDGTPCGEILDQLDYAESVYDLSSIISYHWYEAHTSLYPDPRPPRYFVWSYLPGYNILDLWDAKISADPATYPDRATCFLTENTPNLKIEKDVLTPLLSYSNYGDCTFFYIDSAEKGSLGIPYCLWAVNRTESDLLPVFWSECNITGY